MLLCQEVAFTLRTFVIVGLLANLPRAELAFQQKNQLIRQIQGTNSTRAPHNNETGHSHQVPF